jgi:purine-binding chemotaxis protein CheW
MDIAKIRKKANKRKPAGVSPPEPESPAIDRDVSSPAPAGDDDRMTAGLQKKIVATAAEEVTWEGLDRLFGAETALDLATVEDYDSLLEAGTVEDEAVFRQYLAFNLGREEYALDIRSINEIIKTREFTDVPRAPGFVLGIISLRGVVVPVFDLASRLRLGQSGLTAQSRIIVCQVGELVVGLLVDSISQVIRLADDRIEPPPAILSGLDRDFMTGVGRHQGRMIILLNVANILNVELT